MISNVFLPLTCRISTTATRASNITINVCTHIQGMKTKLAISAALILVAATSLGMIQSTMAKKQHHFKPAMTMAVAMQR